MLNRKHKYYLPTRGNSLVFGHSTGEIGSVVFDGVNQGVVDVA